jgi:hypothetical protein
VRVGWPILFSRVPVPLWTLCATLLILVYIGYASHSDHAADSNTLNPTRDLIDECTPFTSYDGKSALDFSLSNSSVTLQTVRVSPRNKLDDVVYTAADVARITGTFKINESEHVVTVSVEKIDESFLVIGPSYSLQECVLISGTPESANMKASWFGTPPSPDSDGSKLPY